MNLPLVWGWVIGMGPSRSRFRPELVGAGALLAAGFLLKQPAAIAAVPLGLYVLLPSYREARGHRPADSIVQASLLTAGFFGTLGVVAALLRSQGILAEAWYWTFTNHDLPYIFWSRGLAHTLLFVGSCLPLVIGALLGLRDRARGGSTAPSGSRSPDCWPSRRRGPRRAGDSIRTTTSNSCRLWHCSRRRSLHGRGGAGGPGCCLPRWRRRGSRSPSRCFSSRTGSGWRPSGMAPRPAATSGRTRHPEIVSSCGVGPQDLPRRPAPSGFALHRHVPADGFHFRSAAARSGHPGSHRPRRLGQPREGSRRPPAGVHRRRRGRAPGRAIPRTVSRARGAADHPLPPDRKDGGRRHLPAEFAVTRPRLDSIRTSRERERSELFSRENALTNPAPPENPPIMGENTACRAAGVSLLQRVRYAPLLVQMVVIRRCNLACGYCNEFDQTSPPVPTERAQGEHRARAPARGAQLEFTGGEPLLHPDLPELIRPPSARASRARGSSATPS